MISNRTRKEIPTELVIYPYKKEGVWMFDDTRVDLREEPLVCGIPEIVEKVLVQQGIVNGEKGFKLVFSGEVFEEYQLVLEKQEREYAGNWYYWRKENMRGWLCPALYNYFNVAPDKLYLAAFTK